MNIQKLLLQVQEEDVRRLRLARTFVSQLKESSFKDDLHNYQSLGRQIASFFVRFLEGQMFDQDARCQLRFLRDSYMIGGIIPEETLKVVDAPSQDFITSLTEHFRDESVIPIDHEFKVIREMFEQVGLAQPDVDFAQLLSDESDVADSFQRIVGFIDWAGKLQDSDRELSDDEEKILLHVNRWNFEDRGISRQLFLSVESGKGVSEYVVNVLKELCLASSEASELLHGLRQLANGALSIDQFLEKFDASKELEDEDIDIKDEELLKTLGPDFFSKLQHAVLEEDQEDQKRGSRKAKRRMIR